MHRAVKWAAMALACVVPGGIVVWAVVDATRRRRAACPAAPSTLHTVWHCYGCDVRCVGQTTADALVRDPFCAACRAQRDALAGEWGCGA